jgi:hypothetical protein
LSQSNIPFYTFCLFPRADNFTAPGPTKIKRFQSHGHESIINRLTGINRLILTKGTNSI